MDYAYEKIDDYEKSLLPNGFQGNVYNLSYKWNGIILEQNIPMKIMEIGAYHGANVCSLFKTFATHPKSEVHCVDPWKDYDDYPEYKGKQSSNYSLFLQNISKLPPEEVQKIYIHRMLSHKIDAHFVDETFDIIYIDGCHETLYVLQDAMIALKKLVPGGYLIFDDVQDPKVLQGLQMFLNVSQHLIEPEVKSRFCQAYVKKRN
jgi:SAM-dependent methyltransferase